jgi:hypothetical protein
MLLGPHLSRKLSDAISATPAFIGEVVYQEL